MDSPMKQQVPSPRPHHKTRGIYLFIIVLAAFAALGWVIYYHLKNNASPAAPVSTELTVAQKQDIINQVYASSLATPKPSPKEQVAIQKEIEKSSAQAAAAAPILSNDQKAAIIKSVAQR